MGQVECGCQIEPRWKAHKVILDVAKGEVISSQHGLTISYCPLHANAERQFALLEECLIPLETDLMDIAGREDKLKLATRIREALVASEGKEET